MTKLQELLALYPDMTADVTPTGNGNVHLVVRWPAEGHAMSMTVEGNGLGGRSAIDDAAMKAMSALSHARGLKL
jgi:hypothetical protein